MPFGGNGTISTAYPLKNTSISQAQRREIVFQYYLKLVSDGTFQVNTTYLSNYTPHTTRLLPLTEN